MTVLFAGFLIPLMFLLVGAAVEMQTYSVIAENAQSTVDDAALYASRYLPDAEAAEKAVKTILGTSLPQATVSVSASRDTVGIQVQGQYTPTVSAFFNTVLGKTISIPYNASALSRSNPFDVYITIDRSAYLSPSLSADSSEAWGDSGRWGAAEIFNDLLSISYEGLIVDPRIATQQCFNPIYSQLKKSAIKILDYLGSFSMNRVAVSFFPGATRYVGRTRSMNAGINSAEEVSFYDSHIDWDSDSYTVVEERENSALFPVQSTYCASAAEHEEFYDEYKIPSQPNFFASDHQGESLIDQSTWSVNPNYPLSVREVIWSRAVNKNSIMDFELVLNELEYSLFGAGSHDARGGLKNRATQAAFILTDRVPFAAGQRFEHLGDPAAASIQNQLERIRALKTSDTTSLTIFYMLMGGTSTEAAELSEFFSTQRLVSESGKILFDIRVIRGEDLDTVVSNVVSALMLENRGNVLSE